MTLLHHGTQYRLAQTIQRGEIGVDDLVPLIIFHPHQQVIASDARVVDQDVDVAKARLDGGEDGFNGFWAGHIQRHATALLAQVGTDGLGTALAGRGPHHFRATGRKSFGNRTADATTGTGDQHNLIGKTHDSLLFT
ncbi:hypothetical protein D3C79_809820 [compost metagenome]